MNKIDTSALDTRMKELDDPWYTPGDTHLDTSGLNPKYRPVTIERNDFDVPLCNTKHHGTREGWAMQAALDPEIISTLAETPNRTADEDALVKAYTNPAFNFHVPGFKVFAKWNNGGWDCVGIGEEDGTRQAFRLGDVPKDDRDRVMTRCQKHLIPKKLWKELSEAELLTVARMAPGSPESAIYTYINFALPNIDEDVSFNPKYQELCDQIIWFVAESHYPEFDENARAFMLEKLGTRPLTWAMAKELFALYKEEKFNRSRRPSLLFNPPLEPEAEPENIASELDGLSDSALADLRQRTLRLRANHR